MEGEHKAVIFLHLQISMEGNPPSPMADHLVHLPLGIFPMSLCSPRFLSLYLLPPLLVNYKASDNFDWKGRGRQTHQHTDSQVTFFLHSVTAIITWSLNQLLSRSTMNQGPVVFLSFLICLLS